MLKIMSSLGLNHWDILLNQLCKAANVSSIHDFFQFSFKDEEKLWLACELSDPIGVSLSELFWNL